MQPAYSTFQPISVFASVTNPPPTSTLAPSRYVSYQHNTTTEHETHSSLQTWLVLSASIATGYRVLAHHHTLPQVVAGAALGVFSASLV